MKVLSLLLALPLCQIDAFTSTRSLFLPSSLVSRSTLILHSRIADTPEDDRGQVPTKLEQKKINDAKKKVRLPPTLVPSFIRSIIRSIRSRNGSNAILFDLLETISKGGLQDIVDITEEITFSDDVIKNMFFEVKKPDKTIRRALVTVFYRALKYAPPLLLDKDTGDMTEDDYERVIGKKIYPVEMMKVDSPLECFLQNAPVFCAPSPDDETVSICNLNYLQKYQVQKGTPYRYGGKALVKGGDIIEISGVKKGEEEFDTKLNIFLSSFGVHVVLVRHAVMGHLAMYQKYNMRLTANRDKSYQDLWKGHKSPELLLKAMTPQSANDVNYNIQLLIGPGNSLVGRGVSFTNDALTLLNIDIYDEFSHMEPEELIKYLGTKGSKGWNSACLRAWKAAQKTVDVICRKIKENPDLRSTDLRDLSMLLWIGTFYHGFIGDFQLDNVIKGNLPFYLTGEKHKQSVAYGTLSATIGSTTMQRTMDMDTLGKYFYEEEDRMAWKEYQEELTLCAKEVGVKGFTYEGAVYNAIDF